jgi:hypothetical protein
MPFTFSHPAVVLPFNYLSRKWLSLTGLVIGSMTPDFEYFLRMRVLSIYSHTWPGLFWYDAPLGFVLTLVYITLVKDNLIHHLPPYLNKRFSVYKNTGEKWHWHYLPMVLLSVVIGAATHIFWDSFTHPTGYFLSKLPTLKQNVFIGIHHFRLYKMLQQFSSLAGAICIIVVIITLPNHRQTNSKSIVNYWLILLITAALVLIIRLLTGLTLQQYGDVIVTVITCMLLGLIVTSILSLLLKV